MTLPARLAYIAALLCGSLATSNVDAVQPDRYSKVIDRFLAACQSNEQLNEQQRQSIAETIESMRDDPLNRNMAVTQALREIHPAYRAAWESLGSDNLDEAVRQLSALTAADDPFLAADATFFLARAFILREDFEHALPLLQQVARQPAAGNSLHVGDALHLQGISHANMLDREQAIQLLTQYLDETPDAPEYLRVAAWQRIERLKLVEEESISDVLQRMEYSRRRLARSDSGAQTRRQQQQIVDILAKLIEQAQQSESDRQSAGQGEGEGQSQTGGSEQQDEDRDDPRQNNQTPGPIVRRAYGSGPQSPWSHLRDRQRDPAFSAIKSKFPARYEQLIQQYYKSFQDDGE